jgi:hypothetical protein
MLKRHRRPGVSRRMGTTAASLALLGAAMLWLGLNALVALITRD